MDRKHVDFLSALIFMGLSVYVIFEGRRYYQAIQARGAIVFHESPGFLPVIIGTAMLVCSILLLVRSIKGGALGENLQKIKTAAVDLVKMPTIHKAIIGCSWMGLYIFVLLRAWGFVTASVIFLVIFMAFLQFEKLRSSTKKGIFILFAKYTSISVISVGFTYVMFQVIFRVPLP